MKTKLTMWIICAILCLGLAHAGSIEDLDYKDKPCLFCGDQNRQVDDNNVIIDADTLEGETVQEIKDDANDYTDNAVDELENKVDKNNKQSKNRDKKLKNQIEQVEDDSIDRDNDLQDQINQETTDRENADNDLQDSIDHETQNRIDEDNAIILEIDRVDIDSIDRDSDIQSLISSKDETWSRDSKGMNRNTLGRYLTGLDNMEWIFKNGMSYFEWIKTFFVEKSVYINKIEELELKLDKMELEIEKLQEKVGTEESNEFEVAMVTSERKGRPLNVGEFICDSNMEDCITISEKAPTAKELAEIAEKERLEAEKKAQEEYNSELNWHIRMCDKLNIQWHCEAKAEMQG